MSTSACLPHVTEDYAMTLVNLWEPITRLANLLLAFIDQIT